jgi:ferredoxin
MVETYTVKFVNEDVELEVPEHRSILDVGEEMGLDLPYRCRRGICGVCCAKREECGEVDQTQGMFLSDSEQEEGYVLTCIGKPRADLELVTNSSP